MGLIPNQKIRGPNDALRKMREIHPEYDPIREMTALALSSPNEELQYRCHKELAQYVYAKRKMIEIEGAGNENLTFNMNFGPTVINNSPKPEAIDHDDYPTIDGVCTPCGELEDACD